MTLHRLTFGDPPHPSGGGRDSGALIAESDFEGRPGTRSELYILLPIAGAFRKRQ